MKTILSIILFLTSAVAFAQNTPSVVQSKTTGNTSTSTVVFTSSVTAGNALYIAIFDGNAPGDTDTFTDSLGNSYATIGSVSLSGDGDTMAVGCAVASSSGADTITIKINGAANTAWATIYEVANSTCTTDATPKTSNTSAKTACSSTAITTVTAKDFLLGFCGLSARPTTLTAGTGWSNSLLVGNVSTNGGIGETQIGTTAGSYTTTSATFTPSTEQASIIAAFKATASSPAAGFSPSALTFANQNTHSTSAGQTVTLTNTGSASMTLSSIALSTGTQFAISANTCVSTLTAGSNCAVTVTFTPTSTGAKTDNIVFTDNATGSPQDVALSGTGITPVMATLDTKTVGGLSGNISSLNTLTLGTLTSNISSWNGLQSPTVIRNITLGSAATSGSPVNCGFETNCIVPILFNSGGSGFTLSDFYVNIAATGGQILAGIYSAQSGASCPSGASFCAGTLLCSTSAITVVSGVNTIPASSFSSCPTFSANVHYFLDVQTSNGTVTIASETGSLCPGTEYFNFNGGYTGSFALPSTMGTQTQPSADQCVAVSAQFACVGTCGAAPIPWAVITYAGNTSGAAVTDANLATGAYCLNGTFGGTLGSGTTYTNSSTQGFSAAPLCNGSSISGGTLSINRATPYSDTWTYETPGGSNQAALIFWLYNSGNTASSGSQTDLGELDGGNDITVQSSFGPTLCPGGSPCFTVERSGGTTETVGSVPYSQSTWYAAAILNVNGGPHQVAIFSTSGTQIASSTSTCADGKTICITSDNAGAPSLVKMMNDGSHDSAVGTLLYGPVLFDPTGNSWATLGPTYGEMYFPDGPKVIGSQLSAMVDAGFIPHATIKDGRWYSFALHRYLS